MALHPLAGQTAPRSLLVNVPRLVSAYYELKPDPGVPAQRVAFGTSGHRGSSLRASFNEAHILATTQAIWSTAARSGIDGPLFLGMDTHALSEPALVTALEVLAAQRRRGPDPDGPALHADAGDLARDPRLQPRPRRPASPTASSSRRRTTRPRTAASSTTRPTAAPPTPTSRRRSRTAPTRSSRAGWSRSAAARSRRPCACRTTREHDFVAPYVDDLAQRDRPRGDRRREAADRRRPDGRRLGRLLGADRRALRPPARGRQPRRRPDLRVHDPRQGRQDPHGLLVAVRDGQPDRPEGPLRRGLRQRRRLRPPRHRHAERGPDEPEPLPRGGDLVPVPPPPGLARGRRRRQDARLELDDRPRGRGPRAPPGRGAGGLQVVRRGAASTARSASAARRAPAPRSCAGTARSGPPTRTASSSTCWRRDPRRHGQGPRRALPRARGPLRRAGLRAHRRARDARAEGARSAGSPRET